MTQDSSSFARQLTDLREAAKLSQYELARRTGLSRQALSLLELGEREPTWTTVQRLVRALGVDYRLFEDPNLAMPAEEPAVTPRKPRSEVGKEFESRTLRATPATPPAEALEEQEAATNKKVPAKKRKGQ